MYRRSQSPEMMAMGSPPNTQSTFHGLAFGSPPPASPQQDGFVRRRATLFTPSAYTQQSSFTYPGNTSTQQQANVHTSPTQLTRQQQHGYTSPTLMQQPQQLGTPSTMNSPAFLYGSQPVRQESYSSPVSRSHRQSPPAQPVSLFPIRTPSANPDYSMAGAQSHPIVGGSSSPMPLSGTPANAKLTLASHKGVTWSPDLVQEMEHCNTPNQSISLRKGPPLRPTNTHIATPAATKSSLGRVGGRSDGMSRVDTPEWLMVVGFDVERQKNDVLLALKQFGPVAQVSPADAPGANFMHIRFLRIESTEAALKQATLTLNQDQRVAIVKTTVPPVGQSTSSSSTHLANERRVAAGKENRGDSEGMDESQVYSPAIRRLTARYDDQSMNDSLNESRDAMNTSVIGKAFSYVFG